MVGHRGPGLDREASTWRNKKSHCRNRTSKDEHQGQANNSGRNLKNIIGMAHRSSVFAKLNGYRLFQHALDLRGNQPSLDLNSVCIEMHVATVIFGMA